VDFPLQGINSPVIFGNPASIVVPTLWSLSTPCKTLPLESGKLNVALFTFNI